MYVCLGHFHLMSCAFVYSKCCISILCPLLFQQTLHFKLMSCAFSASAASQSYVVYFFRKHCISSPVVYIHTCTFFIAQNMDDISLDATMGFAPLDCNHGVQQGDFCACDEGWASSGIDSKDQEHWCDVRDSSQLPVNTGPKRLTYIQELTAIIVSSISISQYIVTIATHVVNKLWRQLGVYKT